MMHFRNHEKGFTLIEMIISLAIFAIVAVVAVGSLVRIVGLNKRAQTLQSAMNSIGYAMESMTREMRTGAYFHCDGGSYDIPTTALTPKSCPINGAPAERVMVFATSKTAPAGGGATCNLLAAYKFRPLVTGMTDKWTIDKAEQTYCGEDIDANFYPFLSSNVTLTDFKLGVFGSDDSTYGTPHYWTFLRLKGYAGVREQERSDFDIQTSVSQRTQNN